jgi:hypothetical protein
MGAGHGSYRRAVGLAAVVVARRAHIIRTGTDSYRLDNRQRRRPDGARSARRTTFVISTTVHGTGELAGQADRRSSIADAFRAVRWNSTIPTYRAALGLVGALSTEPETNGSAASVFDRCRLRSPRLRDRQQLAIKR